MPSVAGGRKTGPIGLPTTHCWFSTPPLNIGAVSRSFTSIVNVNVSESLAEVLLSESVTVYVYVVTLCVAGVPDSLRVDGTNLTPSGSSGDSV